MTSRPSFPAEYLSPSDVADLASLSRKTVIRAINTGRLRAHKVGRLWRISVENYQAWIQAEKREN